MNNIQENKINMIKNFINKYEPNKYEIPIHPVEYFIRTHIYSIGIILSVFLLLIYGKPVFIMTKSKDKKTKIETTRLNIFKLFIYTVVLSTILIVIYKYK